MHRRYTEGKKFKDNTGEKIVKKQKKVDKEGITQLENSQKATKSKHGS